jgi:predicted permease
MFGRRRGSSDFAAEIEAHMAAEADRLRDEGMDPETARVAAHRAFGNVVRAQERFYESDRWLWWDRVRQDVGFGARTLRKAPGFTVTAVLTLALGIGATTAIFTIVDATLLRPLPYPHPDELVAIEDDLPGVGSMDVGMSTPEWKDWQRSGIFESVSPAWYDDNNLTGSSQPTRVRLLSVAPNYFAVLGVKARLGRTFNPDDPTQGFTLEVVISDGMWKRGFAADRNVIGRAITLDTDAYRIVGVMPPDFRPPGRTIAERNIDVWPAAGFSATPFSEPPTRASHFPDAIARLKRGESIAEAQHRVDALVARLREEYPADYPAKSAWAVRLVPLKDRVVGGVRGALLLLFGAVALVLLIVYVNVANLLLARASTRQREMAVRQALGAARTRLARQLLTESLLLSLLGAIAGVGVLFATNGLLVGLLPESLPRPNDIAVDWRVLLFALGASVSAGVIFGVAPAWQAGQLDVAHVLRQGGRGSAGSRDKARTRRVLVVAEFALSLVLMIAASLLFRSFWDLVNVRLGFDPASVMSVKMRLPYPNNPQADRYGTVAQQARLFRDVLRRSRALPGVEKAAIGNTTAIPLDHDQQDQNRWSLVIEGRATAANQVPLVTQSIVSPEYFHLMGMTLDHGRLFTGSDDEQAPPVAVINEAMAQTFWPNEHAVGQHIRLGRVATTWTTVVGVVADARTETLADARVPLVYASVYQTGAKHAAIFLRGHLDAAAVPDQLRAQVQAVDPTLPVFGAQMLSDTVAASLGERRFSMEIVTVFAVTALLLATLGIYGVTSFLVSARTHEIGIRLALGADPRSIVNIIVREGLRLAVAGTITGLAGAVAAARLMAGLLYGVKPTDALTFVGVAFLLVGVALLACYIPARRAVRAGPLVALSHE